MSKSLVGYTGRTLLHINRKQFLNMSIPDEANMTATDPLGIGFGFVYIVDSGKTYSTPNVKPTGHKITKNKKEWVEYAPAPFVNAMKEPSFMDEVINIGIIEE